MPGSLAEELKRILALQKAKGTRYVWLSPQNAQAFFFSAPWYALSAGLTIVLLILGVGLISDGLGEWDNA